MKRRQMDEVVRGMDGSRGRSEERGLNSDYIALN